MSATLSLNGLNIDGNKMHINELCENASLQTSRFTKKPFY